MSRILEMKPSHEDEVVGRVLIQLHKAIDENFPEAMAASRQFSKTLFSESENTAIVRAPTAESAEAEASADLPELNLEDDKTTSHPPVEEPVARDSRRKRDKPPKTKLPSSSPAGSDLRSQVATQLPEAPETGIDDDSTYTEVIFWGAALIAGLILLAYVAFSWLTSAAS